MPKGFLIGRICALVLLAGLIGSVLLGAGADAEARGIGGAVRPTVILDAGHGGEDSGTVGVNGVYEKDLNLSVAFLLRDLLAVAGVEVIMTRTEDRLLYTEEQNIRGRRKQYDLLNRLLTAKQHPGALFISIHMNAYPNGKYSGFQAWCADSKESRELAQSMQASVEAQLDSGKGRKVKTAGSNIYLLHNAEGVAVLVECGFLSNESDCRKLSSEDYRKRLSFALFCGIMNYLDQDKTSEG
jgi:N-acetylmuramoyl-L-alanine amidase